MGRKTIIVIELYFYCGGGCWRHGVENGLLDLIILEAMMMDLPSMMMGVLQ
jgi:hypothetical protein